MGTQGRKAIREGGRETHRLSFYLVICADQKRFVRVDGLPTGQEYMGVNTRGGVEYTTYSGAAARVVDADPGGGSNPRRSGYWLASS